MALTSEERVTQHTCRFCGQKTLILYGSRASGMLRCTNEKCMSNRVDGTGFVPQFQDEHGELII